MFARPNPHYFPCEELVNMFARDVALKWFTDWRAPQFEHLHNLLSPVYIFEYVRWEAQNKLEIDAYCFADKSRRKKTKKWQNPDVLPLLIYGGWRRLTMAQLVQDELEQLQLQDSPSAMKEFRLALEVLNNIEALIVHVPLWHGFFGMPSPFVNTRDGQPVVWLPDVEFDSSQKTVWLPDF